jgi:hypothetical protein
VRNFLSRADVVDPVRAAFGSDRRPREVIRLEGGSTKGVYRVTLDDGSTTLAYRWHADENFWPAQSVLDLGPFVPDAGRAAFVEQHQKLTGLGVRVPKLVYLDEPADLALVEDLRGGTLEALLARDAARGRGVLSRLASMLRRMHSDTATGSGPSTEEFITERGRRSLAEAAARVPRIAAMQDRLAYELSARSAAVMPRQANGLIHGELGPDHVLLDDAGDPVLIDIEATTHFDVEWEHAFLELRFGEFYPLLHTVELDPARLQLSRLVQYLSLVAGPLLLLDGDFPHREFMLDIAAANTERVLACLSA